MKKMRQESGITRETSSHVAVYLMPAGWIITSLQLVQFLFSLNTHVSMHHLRGIQFCCDPVDRQKGSPLHQLVENHLEIYPTKGFKFSLWKLFLRNRIKTWS